MDKRENNNKTNKFKSKTAKSIGVCWSKTTSKKQLTILPQLVMLCYGLAKMYLLIKSKDRE